MFFLCRPNTWLGQVPRIAIIMSAQMRIVVLIGSEELQHRFVARSLAELDNVSIVIATASTSTTAKADQLAPESALGIAV